MFLITFCYTSLFLTAIEILIRRNTLIGNSLRRVYEMRALASILPYVKG